MFNFKKATMQYNKFEEKNLYLVTPQRIKKHYNCCYLILNGVMALKCNLFFCIRLLTQMFHILKQKKKIVTSINLSSNTSSAIFIFETRSIA